jgi:2-succinyl-5-enolpyruvyl-6-hydroxy-3-cyclohexene-1-carboxylate synthase
MTNIARARALVEQLRAAGVPEFVVCAGSRNSPLLAVLGEERLFSFVDERSAAFFALGRIKLHGNPVAVVTTSGTAAAELLPAAIEAYYSGLPLILVTADRPARFRGTGAPQSIEQEGIFGVYAATELERWSGVGPLHINIEFDEPLIDEALIGAPASSPAGPTASRAVAPRRRDGARPAGETPALRPLVLIGGLDVRDRERVRDFALRLNVPVYAEPLSGLREDRELPLITAGERMLARGSFDSVIRIGNVPTLRFWRDLEMNAIPVTHYSRLPFTGLTRGELHPIEALPVPTPRDRDEAFFAREREQAARFNAILDAEPESELAMFRALSTDVPERALVYLGNSLPIREWDLAATRAPRGLTFEANRGANGIDGQLSTFFGQCDPARENVCVIGDLTALYDLNAPWIVPQLDTGTRFRIVVVNNGGGRIFSRVSSLCAVDPALRERIIENAHDLRFEQWAAMWTIDVTELRPDAEASRRAWMKYDELWS